MQTSVAWAGLVPGGSVHHCLQRAPPRGSVPPLPLPLQVARKFNVVTPLGFESRERLSFTWASCSRSGSIPAETLSAATRLLPTPCASRNAARAPGLASRGCGLRLLISVFQIAAPSSPDVSRPGHSERHKQRVMCGQQRVFAKPFGPNTFSVLAGGGEGTKVAWRRARGGWAWAHGWEQASFLPGLLIPTLFFFSAPTAWT